MCVFTCLVSLIDQPVVPEIVSTTCEPSFTTISQAHFSSVMDQYVHTCPFLLCGVAERRTIIINDDSIKRKWIFGLVRPHSTKLIEKICRYGKECSCTVLSCVGSSLSGLIWSADLRVVGYNITHPLSTNHYHHHQHNTITPDHNTIIVKPPSSCASRSYLLM